MIGPMVPRRTLLIALASLAACQPVPPDPRPLLPVAAPAAPAASIPEAAVDQTAPAVGPPDQTAQAWPRPFFCTPIQPLPDPPPYCTRSIGAVDCWRSPPLAVPARSGLATGRQALTPSQAARRAQCWPGVL